MHLWISTDPDFWGMKGLLHPFLHPGHRPNTPQGVGLPTLSRIIILPFGETKNNAWTVSWWICTFQVTTVHTFFPMCGAFSFIICRDPRPIRTIDTHWPGQSEQLRHDVWLAACLVILPQKCTDSFIQCVIRLDFLLEKNCSNKHLNGRWGKQWAIETGLLVSPAQASYYLLIFLQTTTWFFVTFYKKRKTPQI